MAQKDKSSYYEIANDLGGINFKNILEKDNIVVNSKTIDIINGPRRTPTPTPSNKFDNIITLSERENINRRQLNDKEIDDALNIQDNEIIIEIEPGKNNQVYDPRIVDNVQDFGSFIKVTGKSAEETRNTAEKITNKLLNSGKTVQFIGPDALPLYEKLAQKRIEDAYKNKQIPKGNLLIAQVGIKPDELLKTTETLVKNAAELEKTHGPAPSNRPTHSNTPKPGNSKKKDHDNDYKPSTPRLGM